jgi:predicted MPP superfamily phosphohydrolase
MRLLHLSDIHFQAPLCLTPDKDPNESFRVRLEEDLEEMCSDGVPVDAILVGGDIAYQADPDEYVAAKDWLLRVADACNCNPSRILTVPGNHDVDWTICALPPVSNAQDAVVNKRTFHDRDAALRRQLEYAESAGHLYQPLSAYNSFAAQFNCNLFHGRPFWDQTLEINEGVKLRIFGLNSTIVSGGGDRDRAPGQLFLGSTQTVLRPERDVVALVLCHHPPKWFSDSTEAENLIDARARLQFFGHEHNQRCNRPPEYMRFHAGAVNPERDAIGWKPGYNLVDLCVEREGAERTLKIEAHMRQFQPAPAEVFIPYHDPATNADVWRHSINIPERRMRSMPTATAPGSAPTPAAIPQPAHRQEMKVAAELHTAFESAGKVHGSPPQLEQKSEVEMPEPSTENLVFRFWQLSAREMREIALALGLINEADLDLPPHQRYYKAMEAAKAKGLLAQLAGQIQKHEKKE